MAITMGINTPEVGSSIPSKNPGSKMEGVSKRSSEDMARFRLTQKDEVKNAINQQEKDSDFHKQLQSNKHYEIKGGDVIIDIGTDGAQIPVSVYDEGTRSNNKEAINKKIAAMQKFDPNSPGVKRMINESLGLIDNAIDKGIIKDDPTDPNYAAFCIYATNKSIKKLYPTQNEAANNTVIQESIEKNGGNTTSQAIDLAGGFVCKDFAPTFVTVMNIKKVGTSKIIARESEKHMFAIGNYPGIHGTLRIDAGVNTKEIMENEAVMTYEKLEKVNVLKSDFMFSN